MSIVELLLIAVALSMDAVAVGMTNGMTDCKMRVVKVLLIAAFYGVFQAVMPLVGFFASGLFTDIIAMIAPYLSFALLAFIGGKMIFDGVKELLENKKQAALQEGVAVCGCNEANDGEAKPLSIGKLALQALATSIDALAVGVTLFAVNTAGTLCLNIWLDVLIIGGVTFLLSVGAVYLGKAIGNKLADKAEIVGGAVLVIIGIKLLVEGLLS